MSKKYVLHAEERTEQGKGASRRLRRDGKLPGIVYGAAKDPASITLAHNEVIRYLQEEAFYTQILNLEVDGDSEQVVLRDLQRHPSKAIVLHMDLQRIVADQELKVSVPLHFTNEDICTGVKMEGGVISHVMNEVAIHCLPKHLPEYIEVDLAEVKLGETVHLSDLTVPENVHISELEMGEEHNHVLVSVHAPIVKAEPEDDEVSGEEGAGEGDGDEATDSDQSE